MKSCRLQLAAIVLWFGATLQAAEHRFEITLNAGATNRNEGWVRVPIQVPRSFATVESATLEGPGGPLLGQITSPGLLAEPTADAGNLVARELHFAFPESQPLKAEQSARYVVRLDSDAAASSRERFSWTDKKGDYAELRYGDRPVIRYMYKALDESSPQKREETFKVYHHVFDPEGTRIVTKGPGGLYTHHRGLFYAFNKVTYDGNKTVDVWHCRNGESQSHDGFVKVEAGPLVGRHRVAIGWHGKNGELFAKEERELTVFAAKGGTLIDFASRLRSTGGKIRLDGDPQHAGFHFRADDEVASKTKGQTYYLRPDGKGKQGDTRNWEPKTRKGPVNLPWNAMSFVLGDQRFTCAYFDKPTNPKEARYSERDYGRFGSYFEYELPEGGKLDVNYRVYLQRGELDKARIEALDADFVTPIKAAVSEKR